MGGYGVPGPVGLSCFHELVVTRRCQKLNTFNVPALPAGGRFRMLVMSIRMRACESSVSNAVALFGLRLSLSLVDLVRARAISS